jgi:hypothetical protein
MAKNGSVIRPGIDRLAEAVGQIEHRLQLRGRELRRRWTRIERAAGRGRRSLERDARRRLRRVRAGVGQLRVDLPTLPVPDLDRWLGWLDAFRISTRRDVKRRIDPVERRVDQLSRRLRQLENGRAARHSNGSVRRTRTRRNTRSRASARAR